MDSNETSSYKKAERLLFKQNCLKRSLSYVELQVGFEPTKSSDSGFTVRPRCHWSTPEFLSGVSWSRTTFSGFSVPRIHQVCQSSNVVTRERLELPTPTFVASCSDPTELTSQSAEAEGFEPSEPFSSAR